MFTKSISNLFIILLLLSGCNDSEEPSYSEAFIDLATVSIFFDLPEIPADNYASIRQFGANFRVLDSHPSHGYYTYTITSYDELPSSCEFTVDIDGDTFVYTVTGRVERSGTKLPENFQKDPGLWEEYLDFEVLVSGSFKDASLNDFPVENAILKISNSKMVDLFDLSSDTFFRLNDSTTAFNKKTNPEYRPEFYLVSRPELEIVSEGDVLTRTTVAIIAEDIHGTDYKY